MTHVDLAIIGSGSGNAIPEYLSEWNIVMVERGVFGGTCLNVGCIPSKMFVLPAERALQAASSEHLGISTSFNSFDWPAIVDRVFGRIDTISQSGEQYRAAGTKNLELIKGTAKFIAERTIEVNGRTISADQVLIATGSRPAIPAIEGLDSVRYHTSDTIMRVENFPKRLAIIGGGFIALEMGHVFSALGSTVSIFNRSDSLLRTHDHDISTEITRVFAQRTDLRLGVLPQKVAMKGESVQLTLPDESTLEVDELLVATGRQTNSDLLNLAATGLKSDPSGLIPVDENMATEATGIWAIGDAANPFMLKHLANREAAVAFWNMAHSQDLKTIDRKVLPHAVFTHPQIGSVGLTENQAKAAGLDFVIGRKDYSATAYGWALADETSFAKILLERSSGLIMGAHIIGPQAASLVQLLAQAMQFGQTAEQLAREPYYIHPALTEVVENALLEAIAQL